MINYKLEKTLFELFYFFIIEFWFVYCDYPWFYRGASFVSGSDIGAFAFGIAYGQISINGSFRDYYYFLKIN